MAELTAAPASVNARRRVGNDLVEEEYTSAHGLHVIHATRFGNMPDVDAWAQAYPNAQLWVYFGDDGRGHVWIAWKEQ
jgi:hypothetical protein